MTYPHPSQNKRTRSSILGLSSALLLSLVPSLAIAGPPPGVGKWTLSLNEDFNGTSLNTAIWNTGHRFDCVLPGELQGYRPENVTVSGGICRIKSEYKPGTRNKSMTGYECGTTNYASGMIQTYNKWTQTYGYFEARIKMGNGKGTWPAFWLLPDRGAPHNVYYRAQVGDVVTNGGAPCPMGNEIDIFEYMGTWQNQTTGLSQAHVGYFWGYGGSSVASSYVMTNQLVDPNNQFHTYGLYWGPGILIYYIDGRPVWSRKSPSTIAICPEYLLVNCAISQNDWTGTPVPLEDITASFPSTMEVDYVKVYTGSTAGNESGDIGTVGLAGSNSVDAATGVYTVTASGADIWGTSDAFHYVTQTITGDCSVVAKVTGLTNTNGSAKAGVMIRSRVDETNAPNACMVVTANAFSQFQYRLTSGASTGYASGPYATFPKWVRIDRTGNVFTGYLSSNGTTWTQVGTPQTIVMPSTVYVGLAATSHNNSAVTTATFSDVRIDPFFAGQDIGPVGLAGSDSLNAGVYTIQGAGRGDNDFDACRYLSQTLIGDGSITAKVNSVTRTDYAAFAGVMMRADNSPRAPFAAMRIPNYSKLRFAYRTVADTTAGGVAGATVQPPRWARVTRVGDVFTASYSSDGINWTELGSQTISMPTAIKVGLMVSSHHTDALCTAVIDNVTITGKRGL